MLILGFAAVFGLVVVREYQPKSGMNIGQFILFVAGAVIVGVIFNSIMFEVAHIIGGKAGRYIITSVNVLGFNFYKENDKRKFRFCSYDGLTGETKIIPNKKKKKPSNPVPYLIFGSVFYLIEVAIVVVLFAVLNRSGASNTSTNIAYFILTIMAVGGMILFYNIVPLQLDSLTDGYRLRLVSGKKNKEAFNSMLLGETSTEQEHNEEHVDSSFSSDIKLNQVYVKLNEGDYVGAEQLVDSILSESQNDKKVSQRTIEEAKTQKVFLVFMNKNEEEAKEYCDANLSLHDKKRLSEEDSLSSLRSYVLISSHIDRSKFECLRALSKVYKAYKRTSEGRRELESKLFNITVDKVNEKHPDWNVLDYKINIK